ncbi:MAG: hypothetical protein M3O33_14940 [Cyanobacteriota bacterium]|nr:hypothetical protein [Cyanobacteriota bacterium]
MSDRSYAHECAEDFIGAIALRFISSRMHKTNFSGDKRALTKGLPQVLG